MHFQASRTPQVTPLPAPFGPVKPAAAPSSRPFAEVFDLAIERERRTPPAEVLDAVAEAARVYEELQAAGLHVHFNRASSVTAELRDSDGTVVRPLSLRDVIDPSNLLPPNAA
jgi:hypothetical protein